MYEKILSYLSPVLGEATAKNLLKHYCLQMHLAVEEIPPGRVPELANAMRPPGAWQVYEVVWTAPRFNADGSLKDAKQQAGIEGLGHTLATFLMRLKG